MNSWSHKNDPAWNGPQGHLKLWLKSAETTFDISSTKVEVINEEDRKWLDSVRTDRIATISPVVDKKHAKSVKQKFIDTERKAEKKKSWSMDKDVR
jgi:hypothetical protein